MPAIVAPPPKWMWEHAPHEMKLLFLAASGFTAIAIMISFCHSCSMMKQGRDIANKQRHIQLPVYVQRNLSIVSKPLYLSFFAWMSLVIMPFARVNDIILAVALAFVVQSFADLCIGHLRNSTEYLEAVEDHPMKWWASPPCCFFRCCVKEEELKLKHLRRASSLVAMYVFFIPVDAFITMVRDTAFTPQVELDSSGYCSAASTSKHAPYNPGGLTTLIITMCGMWGVGVLATSVDLCLGHKAGAKSQLSFIRMYQLLGLLKGIVGHFSKNIMFEQPTYPIAAISNFDAITYDYSGASVEAVSSVVNCPVFDHDMMSRAVFLTFSCFWMLLIAVGNMRRFTIGHELDVMDLESHTAEKLKQGLLHYTRAPPIQDTLG